MSLLIHRVVCRPPFIPLLATAFFVPLSPATASAADLVRGVRSKLSAGDLASGYAAELRREIRQEKAGLVLPLGAAIRFLEGELERAKDAALRSRIRKSLDLLTLEGQPAPALGLSNHLGPAPRTLADLRGRPVLLFLFARWCGDCKAEAPTLARLLSRYGPRGLSLVGATRLSGPDADGKPATPAEEMENLEKTWRESYPGLEGVPIVVDTETMVRYGASATPTYVLVDRMGIVRLYAPTRVAESELARRIEELLAETDGPA